MREAATLMGRSPRTVRAQLARGELPGVKRDGRWRVHKRHLPLTESQQRALDAKADTVRVTVEDALTSRRGPRSGERSRSIADLDAFRLGAEVLAKLRSTEPEHSSSAARQEACESLEASLLALAEASLHFEQRAKRAALDRCRSNLARTVARLLLSDDGEVASGCARQLEDGMAPAVAGFARWIDRLGRKQR